MNNVQGSEEVDEEEVVDMVRLFDLCELVLAYFITSAASQGERTTREGLRGEQSQGFNYEGNRSLPLAYPEISHPAAERQSSS